MESIVWTSQLWTLQTLGYVIFVSHTVTGGREHMDQRISHVQVPYFVLQIILRKVGFWITLFTTYWQKSFAPIVRLMHTHKDLGFPRKCHYTNSTLKVCTHMVLSKCPTFRIFHVFV